MTEHHLAQCNIARLRAPLDSQQLAGFVAALDPINALADDAPGFVWRLQTEDGDATSIRAFDDDMLLINMSVWESVEALAAFVYSSEHREVMRGRRQWFERMSDAYLVLWWVPAGVQPTPTDARERLDELRRNGPSPDAFTFRQPFPPPGAGDGPLPARDEWYCTL
jgi:heme-degrading monooxygenase HmoA